MYHHNTQSGTIHDHPQHFTEPITNLIYNTIIYEAKKLKLQPYISHIGYLCIKLTPPITLVFKNTDITLIDHYYDITTIPYTEYTTLKQLINKHL